MDMLNRLKNTVTNVISGNPLTKEFDILAHRASAGPGLLWKVHNGVKKTTKQEVSIFVFDKKQLERYHKHDRDVIVDTLKKGVSQLTRLRHPKILSVLHPIEETRDVLSFATEPVFASLANVLNSHENLPNPIPQDIKEHQLYDVEIKYGLLQITEGLMFLHNDVKLVHCNINPESIIINQNGAWKIAGFDCCILNNNSSEQAPFFPFREWSSDLPPVIQPRLDYLPPEWALSMSCDTSSDMFSLGVLFFSVFNKGKTIYRTNGQWSTFKNNVMELKNLKMSVLGSIPEGVRDHVKLLINTEPTVRPDPDQLSKIPFFEDVGAMTLQYLDTLFQRDNLQKSQFFKGLPSIISKMPKRVCLQRVLPCLMKECVNHDMIPFILPCVMLISEQATKEEYEKRILPELIPLFKVKEPIQVMLIFLQNMNLLLSKTPQAAIKAHVLPMLNQALESDTPQIQELCLLIIPTFASLIDYSALKNSIIPRIRKLCLGTTTLSVRVNCLLCIGKLLEYMDKWYVLDDIFPIIQQIPSREPAVLMSILGIYKVTMTHKKLGITKDILASKVLPYVIPLCIDNNLNLGQFNAFITVVKEMIGKVEKEHRTKLEQLDTMQQEQRSLQLGAESVVSGEMNGTAVGTDDKQNSMMDKFLSGLGLGSMFGSTSTTTKGSAKSPESEVAQLNATTNDIPIPKPEATRLPNQPAKVSLSMEEKQRLAREQEQQQRYKSQKPLTLENKTATAAPSTNKPQVKDLTSTLMSADLMSNSVPKQRYPSPTTGGTTSGSVFGSNKTKTSHTSYGMTSNSAFNATSPTGMASTQWGQQQPQQSKPMNMSSLDNLLPSSQAKMSMNQINSQRPQQTSSMGGFGGLQQQGMIGMQRPMGMMGGQSMMGMQGTMGMQGNVGMQGNIGMQSGMGMGNNMNFRPIQPQQPNIMTPQNMSAFNTGQQKPTQNTGLSKSDLNDFLGL